MTKKYAQKFWSNDLEYKKPSGYRVIHQNSLLPCPGQNLSFLDMTKFFCLRNFYIHLIFMNLLYLNPSSVWL